MPGPTLRRSKNSRSGLLSLSMETLAVVAIVCSAFHRRPLSNLMPDGTKSGVSLFINRFNKDMGSLQVNGRGGGARTD